MIVVVIIIISLYFYHRFYYLYSIIVATSMSIVALFLFFSWVFFSTKLKQCVNEFEGNSWFSHAFHTTCINIKLETVKITNYFFRLLKRVHVFIHNLQRLLLFVRLLATSSISLFNLNRLFIVYNWIEIKCVQFYEMTKMLTSLGSIFMSHFNSIKSIRCV